MLNGHVAEVINLVGDIFLSQAELLSDKNTVVITLVK